MPFTIKPSDGVTSDKSPTDLTTTVKLFKEEPSVRMSFRIRATTLIVIWSSTASVLSSWLQNRGNSRVMFPKLPSLYALRLYRRYVLLINISRLFSLKKHTNNYEIATKIILKMSANMHTYIVMCILFYNPKFFCLRDQCM